jgi:hypothetical protein
LTLTESRTAPPEFDAAQLLFQEAKQRRRRRWLVSGIVSLVILVVMGVTFGLSVGRRGGGTQPPIPSAAVPAASTASAADFSVRPVLCYAPDFAPTSGLSVGTGTSPTCGPAFQLTPAHLGVSPETNSVGGFIVDNPGRADPSLAAVPSTSSQDDTEDATVLLPGAAASDGRFVLGPAGLTGAGIQSATAVLTDGQWTVLLRLTAAGSAQWDALAQEQFHAFVGVVVDGHVISAPITQPTQSSFTSFEGELQLADSFGRQQAEALAARL